MSDNSTLNLFNNAIANSQGTSEGMADAFGKGEAVDIKDIRAAEEQSSEENSDIELSADNIDDVLSIPQDESPEGEENNKDVDAENSDSLSEESEDVSDQENQKPSEDSVEWLSVTDHKGRQRKVKVDYSDKEAVKRAYNLAAGARKWQIEKDDAIKQLSEFKEVNSSKIENWDSISSIYEEKGIEGLVNFLEGDDNAFDNLLDQRQQFRDWKSTASPEEIQRYERDLQTQAESRKYEQEMKALKEQLESLQQSQASKEEESMIRELQTLMNPAFEKYRFAGKLGNSTREEKVDGMVWAQARETLANYPDDVELTRPLVERAFKEASMEIRELINIEADKRTTKTIANKKKQAMQRAQASTSKALSNGDNRDIERASDMLKQSGRLADFFRLAAKKNPDGFMKK